MRGLPRKGLVAALFMAALFLQMVPAVAAPEGDPVARVIKISDGGRLDFSRTEGKWYQAYLEMDDYLNDQLRTNEKTFGSIELERGGQIGINKNTTVKITSDSKVIVIDMEPGGSLWGKLTKDETKPVEIRTSSGVMGIRGTEFVITDKGDEGTEVSVLEGEVSAQPEEGGEAVSLKPGDSTTIKKLMDVPVVTNTDPDDLRKDILKSQEWEDFNQALRWAHTINRYTPGYGFSRELYWAGRGVQLVTNPEEAVRQEAASQVNRRVGFGVGSALNKASKKDPDFPSNLRPDAQADSGGSVSADNVNFSWDKLKKAKKYFVMVGRDEGMEERVWTYQTGENETSVKYPAEAQPLEPGQYYWRVIGLNKDGDPVKKAAQTYFTVE
jgi:uncharacterized cupin superfamily protein